VFNGRGNTRYTNGTYKALNAQRHGAIAILTTADVNNHPQAQVAAGRGAGGRGGRGEQAPTRPRIPSEALAEGGPEIPVFTISSQVAADLFAAAGKTPAEVQTAID